MPTAETALPPSPGEQYIKALWDGRWLFVVILAASVGAAILVTALLPRWYSSGALLSIRVAPRLDPNVTLYANPDPVFPPAISSSGSAAITDDEAGANRFVRRFQANSLVTAAARDAGLIGPADRLEDRQVRSWLSIQALDKTDLVTVTAHQPTAEGAQRLAAALVAKAIEANQAEAAGDPATKRLLDEELHRATAAMTQAEAAIAQASGPGSAVAADRAKLELSLAREQYAAVRRRLGMLDLARANQRFLLTVVDPPTLPLRPSFPRLLLNVGIGLILGVLAATTFTSLRSVLQKT